MAHPYALEDFENMWRTLLVTSGLTGGLHMAEAMSWSGDVWSRKRAEWGDEAEPRRAMLLRGFVEVIRSSPLRGVGNVADSRFISEKAANTLRPDLVMFEKALERATAAMPQDSSLTVLCDWEDGFDELCCRLMAKLRIERPEIGRRVKLLGFCDDASYAEIQAADMFAYLACKHALRLRDTPEEPPDPLFALLTEQKITQMSQQPMVEMLSGETFRRMVEAHRR